MFEIDQDFMADDPGNQLRMKLNATASIGSVPPVTMTAFGEVLYTATERGILPFRVTDEHAMTIVRLYWVARSIAESPDPNEELKRVQL